MNNIKALIVPDVHARSFWRESVLKTLNETNAPIIFLGDYLDPYTRDFFDSKDFNPKFEEFKNMDDVRDMSLKMLEEIIELKKTYPNRIILLIGNHDCSYIYGKKICNCRYDEKNSSKISKLFNDNRKLFQLAYELTINNKHFIFSHAGINKKYAYDCFKDTVNENNVVSLFNKAYDEDNFNVINSLALYSFYRGSEYNFYGSIVWADAREWGKTNDAFGYSVVGHTQLEKHIITDNFAFLDARECFFINDNNEIKKFE